VRWIHRTHAAAVVLGAPFLSTAPRTRSPGLPDAACSSVRRPALLGTRPTAGCRWNPGPREAHSRRPGGQKLRCGAGYQALPLNPFQDVGFGPTRIVKGRWPVSQSGEPTDHCMNTGLSWPPPITELTW
jgi:hypothetical protein